MMASRLVEDARAMFDTAALGIDFDLYRDKSAALLRFLGFDRETGLRLTEEAWTAAYGPPDPRKSEMKHGRHCLDLIRSSGMLSDAPTREALIDSGWVAP